MALPQGPNQRWSLDFLSDAFADGRRFRILAIVDDFTRECLTLVPASSDRGYRGVVESGANPDQFLRKPFRECGLMREILPTNQTLVMLADGAS